MTSTTKLIQPGYLPFRPKDSFINKIVKVYGLPYLNNYWASTDWSLVGLFFLFSLFLFSCEATL